MSNPSQQKNAILLVMFGTSVEEGLSGLLQIRERFIRRFPRSVVRVVFTSRIIRKIWQDRSADPHYRETHPAVPEEILCITKPAEAIKELRDSGTDALVIQPVHIAPAVQEIPIEKYTGEVVDNTVAKFERIAVGRPALGLLENSNYPFQDDIKAVAGSLLQDIERARQEKSALFYLGHGNTEPETERIYQDLLMEIRYQYPDVRMYMGMVEGGPPVEEIVEDLRKHNVARVILKPFMLVAGDHVRKDMIGEGTHTLKSVLENAGFIVQPVLSGLGEMPAFADVFIQHCLDAAKDAGIVLE